MADRPTSSQPVHNGDYGGDRGDQRGDQRGDDAAFDQRLRLAMQDVSLPDGLAARLKLAVRAAARPIAREADQAVAISVPSTDADDSSAAVLLPMSALKAGEDHSDSHHLRRGVLVALFAAAVCGFAWLANQWRQPAEKSWLVAHSQAIVGKWEEDNPANMELAESAFGDLPEGVRAQLSRLKLLGTRELSGLDRRWTGQLLRLDAGDGRAVVLLKLPKLPVVRGLNSRFEILPTSSGAWSLAALTVGEETYVLAANCTQQQLFQYIRRAAVT